RKQTAAQDDDGHAHDDDGEIVLAAGGDLAVHPELDVDEIELAGLDDDGPHHDNDDPQRGQPGQQADQERPAANDLAPGHGELRPRRQPRVPVGPALLAQFDDTVRDEDGGQSQP